MKMLAFCGGEIMGACREPRSIGSTKAGGLQRTVARVGAYRVNPSNQMVVSFNSR